MLQTYAYARILVYRHPIVFGSTLGTQGRPKVPPGARETSQSGTGPLLRLFAPDNLSSTHKKDVLYMQRYEFLTYIIKVASHYVYVTR